MIVLNKVSRQSIFPGFAITVTKKKGADRKTFAQLFNSGSQAWEQAAEDADDSMEWGNCSGPTNLRCD